MARLGNMNNKDEASEKKLALVQQAYIQKNQKAIIVLEGVDAAGKGGLIRRLAWSMDPRALKVWPIGAPNEMERHAHYLSRFWARLPSPGEIAVFDRSWYGRVLVERIEGLIDDKTRDRAYSEINEFEKMLIDDSVRVIKLLLRISKKEQSKRLAQRLEDPEKNWKLTFDDIRNRDRWRDYEKAYKKMVLKTSKKNSQWKVIESDEKDEAREMAIDYLTKELSRGLSLKPAPVSEKLKKLIEKL